MANLCQTRSPGTSVEIDLVSLQLAGGERGIRTPGGFKPTHAFQACALNHSAISPTNDRTVKKLFKVCNIFRSATPRSAPVPGAAAPINRQVLASSMSGAAPTLMRPRTDALRYAALWCRQYRYMVQFIEGAPS